MQLLVKTQGPDLTAVPVLFFMFQAFVALPKA